MSFKIESSDRGLPDFVAIEALDVDGNSLTLFEHLARVRNKYTALLDTGSGMRAAQNTMSESADRFLTGLGYVEISRGSQLKGRLALSENTILDFDLLWSREGSRSPLARNRARCMAVVSANLGLLAADVPILDFKPDLPVAKQLELYKLTATQYLGTAAVFDTLHDEAQS